MQSSQAGSNKLSVPEPRPLIETPTPVGALCDQLVQEFEVERATCEADVLGLLNKLLMNNLIRVAHHS